MKKLEDERIVAGKRRINSSAFGIGFLGLWGILLYRQFVLRQEPSAYMDIFLLTLGLSIYVTVNNVLRGYYLTYRSRYTRRKVNLISAAVGSVTFTVVQAIFMKAEWTNGKDLLQLLLSLAVFFTVWVIGQSVLFKVSDDKSNKDIE